MKESVVVGRVQQNEEEQVAARCKVERERRRRFKKSMLPAAESACLTRTESN